MLGANLLPLVVSRTWTVVSWIRQLVVEFALAAFLLVELEVTRFLLAAAFVY